VPAGWQAWRVLVRAVDDELETDARGAAPVYEHAFETYEKPSRPEWRVARAR